jgi:hypothetical protein
LTKVAVPGTVRVRGTHPLQNDLGFHSGADCAGAQLAATWFTSHAFDSTLTTPPTRLVSGFGGHCSRSGLFFRDNRYLDVFFSEEGLATQDVCYLKSDGTCKGTPYEDHCGAHEVLVGFDLRLGDLMDSIAAVCAPVVTVYK